MAGPKKIVMKVEKMQKSSSKKDSSSKFMKHTTKGKC